MQANYPYANALSQVDDALENLKSSETRRFTYLRHLKQKLVLMETQSKATSITFDDEELNMIFNYEDIID